MSYIYEILSVSAVAQALYDDKNAGWSSEGARALAEFIADIAYATDEPIELDVIAIRCEFAEYDDLAAFNDENGFTYATIEDLEEDTTVIRVDTGAIIVKEF